MIKVGDRVRVYPYEVAIEKLDGIIGGSIHGISMDSYKEIENSIGVCVNAGVRDIYGIEFDIGKDTVHWIRWNIPKKVVIPYVACTKTITKLNKLFKLKLPV